MNAYRSFSLPTLIVRILSKLNRVHARLSAFDLHRRAWKRAALVIHTVHFITTIKSVSTAPGLHSERVILTCLFFSPLWVFFFSFFFFL